MHETGHGLYEQASRASSSARRSRTALARPPRVPEPDVGEHGRPQPAVLALLLPAAAGDRSRRRSATSSSTTGTAPSTGSQPSLIRVEADEATYNLHIILRFELEQELLADAIELEELPEIWNQRMKDYLGVEPAERRPRRPPGHALGRRRDRLLLDVRARQRHLRAALGEGDGRDPGPARPVRAGRVRRARRLAAGQPLAPRAQVHAARD